MTCKEKNYAFACGLAELKKALHVCLILLNPEGLNDK